MKDREKIEFKGTIKRCVYDSPDFKIYGVEADKEKYPSLKFNVYKNVTIIGDLPALSEDVEYDIVAIEKETKYGTSYQVLNIKRNIPTTSEEIYAFLKSILTENQAKVLYQHYPNILDLVKNNKTDEVDLSKLRGIGEYTFNKIKERIIDNLYLTELIAEFQGYFTISMIRKLYTAYSSLEKVRAALLDDPYAALIGLSRVGFKTADRLLLDIDEVSKANIEKGEKPIIDFGFDIKTSPQRCLACVLYLLRKNEENGSTKMNLIDLRSECIKTANECIDHFTEVIKHKDIYFDKDKLEIALSKTREVEAFICQNIEERLFANRLHWLCNAEAYRNLDGAVLSDEQVDFLRSVCKNNLVVLTAPAGCGKSFSTKALINMLEDNKKTFSLLSPTGKAAKRLSQYTGRPANTIHKVLMALEDSYKDGDYNAKLNVNVVIVDEVGMTDIFLFKRLLDVIDINTKIVLIGDAHQLNSVGCGALLRDLISSDEIPHVQFTQVFRMGEGGVLTACTFVRQNKKFISKNVLTQIGEDKSYSFIPAKKEQMNEMVVHLYKKLLQTNDSSDITVISSYNIGENGCGKLNQLLQPIANPSCLTSNKFIKTKQDGLEIKYYVGDIVIQNRNNYRANVWLGKDEEMDITFIPNGTQGKVVDIIDDNLIIRFEDEIICYPKDELGDIKHSFALSTHKMQGSQNKIIIFCCPSSHVYMLSNNIVYTAISRAEEKVYQLSDAKTMNIAMNKSDSDKRQTFLGDMLNKI